MTTTSADVGPKLQRLMELHDHMPKSDIHERRAAYKPLHDFMKQGTRYVLTELIGLEPAMVDDWGLSRRVQRIVESLAILNDAQLLEEGAKWKSYITNDFEKTRNAIEHHDNADALRLSEQREKAIQLVKWLFEAGSRYHKATPEFGARSRFIQLAQSIEWQVERTIEKFGQEVPYALTRSDTLGEGASGWGTLPEAVQNLRTRVEAISASEEPCASDYEILIEIERTLSRLDAAEGLLIRENKCPRCGGEFEEVNEVYSVGNPEDGHGVQTIWIGCKSCRFEVHSDQVDI